MKIECISFINFIYFSCFYVLKGNNYFHTEITSTYLNCAYAIVHIKYCVDGVTIKQCLIKFYLINFETIYFSDRTITNYFSLY